MLQITRGYVPNQISSAVRRWFPHSWSQYRPYFEPPVENKSVWSLQEWVIPSRSVGDHQVYFGHSLECMWGTLRSCQSWKHRLIDGGYSCKNREMVDFPAMFARGYPTFGYTRASRDVPAPFAWKLSSLGTHFDWNPTVTAVGKNVLCLILNIWLVYIYIHTTNSIPH